MKKMITRRNFLKGAGATAIGLAAMGIAGCGSSSSSSSSSAAPQGETKAAESGEDAAAEPTHFTAAHASTNESTLGQFFLAIQAYLEENTDDLRMDLYPAGQLGSDAELAESIVEGSIQMTSGAAANYVGVVPELCIFDIPFAFDSYWQMRKAMEDEAFLDELKKVLEPKGLTIGCVRAEGFRTLFTKEPIATVEDVKGLQLRVMDNKYHIQLWKDLGASTTTVAFTELYTALEQGVVTAQENTITATLANYNLYEVTNYATISKHEATIHPMFINNDFFMSLTEQQQKELMEACAYAHENEADLEMGDQESLEMLKKDYNYEVFEWTVEELDACREATADVRDMVKENVSDSLYDAYMNAIEANK